MSEKLKSNIFTIVKKAVLEYTGIFEVEDALLTDPISKYVTDSLDHIEIIMAIEDEIDIELEEGLFPQNGETLTFEKYCDLVIDALPEYRKQELSA